MTRLAPSAAGLALPLLLAACGQGGTAAGGARPVPVRVDAAVEKAVPVEVRAVGRIVADASVALRAQVSGQITAVRFAEGAAVRRGDALVEIDRRPYQAALAQARAALARDEALAANARADATRLAQLAEREFVTRQQAEAAAASAAALAATLEAARAAVQRAELDLSWCTVRAPISGRTGRLLADPGNLVTAGAADLVTIEQVRPVWAAFSIPARHLPALRARATPATARVVAEGSDRPVVATVEFVDNAVDASGTILLKARIPNEDEALWPGQVVEVRLRVAERARAVVVPTAAISAGQQGDAVWVVEGGAARLRPVVVAEAGERETVVASGLAPGETVVTEGQLKLVPGARVEPLAPAGEAKAQPAGEAQARPAGEAQARPAGGGR